MTTAPRTSLVIVSRHRPAELRRCLTAVAQQDHPDFELIVVADPAACAMLEASGTPAKIVRFDAENISAARNAGIAAAAGEVVAFTDDDAVPEPTWLSRLTAPFAAAAVMAAGGYVRGRNGISYQWQGGMIDRLTRPLPGPPMEATAILKGSREAAPEVKGVNCAYRRDMLLRLGGFDPELRYYLDESELNLRLAAAGAAVAIVPDAQVHHVKAGSGRRNRRRIPTTLADIGASTAVTLRRHRATVAETEATRIWLRAAERRKLLDLMVAGEIEPDAVGRLLSSLDAGFAEGSARALHPLAPLADLELPFVSFGTGARPGRVVSGRIWQARRLRAHARAAAAGGEIVTLFLLGPSLRYHWMRYDDAGFWEQNGGLFGRSERGGPIVHGMSFILRIRQETARIARYRPV